jgi:DNA-binding response OmpR family regulator
MRTNNPDSSTHPCGVILVVDDEEFNRQLLRDSLEAQGHTVVEAQAGEESIRLAQEHRPDVILLDLMMPGMDGFQVCKKLKQDADTASIPVIMITALTDRKERLMGIQSGASEFLGKPVDLTEVILRVRNAITMQRLYAQLQQSFDRHKELEAIRDKLVHFIMRGLRTPVREAVELVRPLAASAPGRMPADDAATLEKLNSVLRDLNGKLESATEFSRAA